MSDKPIIALDYTPAVEQGGGIGRYVRELVKALAATDERTQYRLFVAGSAENVRPQTPGANFAWCRSLLSGAWHARLWHRARVPIPVEWWTGAVDLFHATDFTLPPVRSRTRTLLTVHDLSFVLMPETATQNLRVYLQRVVPRSIARADHVLADSEATRQDILTLYGTAPEKVSTLHSGVEARFRRIVQPALLESVKKRYGIGDGPFILSIGTVQPRKNYARLARAIDQSNIPDLKLVIAGGKGWLADDLYETIEQLGLQERVQLIGFVDDDDLPALYSAALALAFPSLYEGFGLPVLEAMACELPVVTSNVSSLPEVAGEAAILIDPEDIDQITEALRQVIFDSALRALLVKRGLERAASFTWEKAAGKLRGHYRRLLGQKK